MKTMTLSLFIGRIGLIGPIVFLAGCHQPAPTASKPDAPPPTVKTTNARRGEISRTVSLPGVLVANQQATLYAKVGGYLQTIKVDKGDPVKAGDLLAEIVVPELLADLEKYKAEADVAEIDFRRVTDAQTKAPDLVTQQSIDTAKGRREVAQANLRRAQVLLDFCQITAPFSGTVTRRMVDPGAFIPAATSGTSAQNAALLTVADFRIVRLQVAVPEAETPFIRNGLPVRVTVEELPGTNFSGTISRFSHALDDASKTMLAEIDLPNDGGPLLPGMFGTARIAVETRKDTQLIPVEAVVVEKTGTSVFVLTDTKAAKTPVKTGFNDGINVEITEGVKPTDTLIVPGKLTLNNGQAVTVAK